MGRTLLRSLYNILYMALACTRIGMNSIKEEESKFYDFSMLIIDTLIKSSLVFRALAFILLTLIHVVLVCTHSTFDYLASFGGLMTVIGFIFIFGYSLPEYEPVKPNYRINKRENGYELDQGGTFSSIVSDDYGKELMENYETKSLEHQEYLKIKRKHLFQSFYFTILGTVTWAYAGYLDVFIYK